MVTLRGTHHVFDLVFKRSIQELSHRAVVSLVNGLFGTDFPLDSEVSFPNREKVTEDLRQIVSDMIVMVAGEVFHIEAQIDEDLNMALRMFRYGYHEAVGRPQTGGDGSITIEFPQARILFWETTRRTPDMVTLHVIFPDRSRHDFQVPAFKVLEHDPEEFRRLGLAALLPFYILKYRRQAAAAQSPQARRELAPEMGKTMKSLLAVAGRLREQGILTEDDETYILGEMQILYSELYEPYEELREARVMIEDRLVNPYTKWKTQLEELKKEFEESKKKVEASKRKVEESEKKVEESKRELEESRLATRVEDAKKLIEGGVASEVVARILGITPEDIAKYSKAS
jgi:hypothetical protein